MGLSLPPLAGVVDAVVAAGSRRVADGAGLDSIEWRVWVAFAVGVCGHAASIIEGADQLERLYFCLGIQMSAYVIDLALSPVHRLIRFYCSSATLDCPPSVCATITINCGCADPRPGKGGCGCTYVSTAP